MNKDVIYIEPEDDITDILANIKSAKSKIVAIVPPKKAGVLRSVVNFKLIAKTAAKAEKTVVLVSSDESLKKLASVVAMPVAKTLQSKPEIPGRPLRKIEHTSDDVIEEEKPVKAKPAHVASAAVEDEEAEDAADDEEEEEKLPAKKPEKKVEATKSKAQDEEADIEIDGEEEDKKDAKKAAFAKKLKAGKLTVPDFKKFRVPIIIGAVAIIALIAFTAWANLTEKVNILVKVKANEQNFAESIRLTTNEGEKDIKSGVFVAEEKIIEKKSELEFEATGEKNKGQKATGTVIIERPSGEVIDCNGRDDYFTIQRGTAFTYNGKKYITTEAGSANIPDGSDYDDYVRQIKEGSSKTCTLRKPVSSGQIPVEAEDAGDDYNTPGSASGWSNPTMSSYGYKIIGSDMSGGTTEKVKVVKEDDVRKAETDLLMPTESEIRELLSDELGSGYIIIASSYKVEDSKTTTTPSVDEEVKDGQKAKLVKEAKYKIYAVNSADLEEFIKLKAEESIGDGTQIVYSTGLETNSIFIDSYRDDMTAKVKSKIKTGPKIDEDMIAEQAYGEKLGKLSSKLKSLNGVYDVKIDKSHFWTTKVPTKPEKVTIELKID